MFLFFAGTEVSFGKTALQLPATPPWLGWLKTPSAPAWHSTSVEDGMPASESSSAGSPNPVSAPSCGSSRKIARGLGKPELLVAVGEVGGDDAAEREPEVARPLKLRLHPARVVPQERKSASDAGRLRGHARLDVERSRTRRRDPGLPARVDDDVAHPHGVPDKRRHRRRSRRTRRSRASRSPVAPRPVGASSARRRTRRRRRCRRRSRGRRRGRTRCRPAPIPVDAAA